MTEPSMVDTASSAEEVNQLKSQIAALEQLLEVHERTTIEQSEKLAEQSYLTRTIADNATVGMFMMDVHGHPTFMNPAAEEMTGYTLDEIRDMPLHDAIHHTHPDGTPYPMSECPIDRALPENNNMRAHEDIFVRKDGTFFPVSVAARPILRNGKPTGTVVEVRDVTEERRTEAERERLIRELAVERARLAELFRDAPAFIAAVRGPHHVFDLANPAYLQLVGNRDILGKPVAEALPEVVEQGFTGLLDQVYSSGEPFLGNEVPVLLQRTPATPPEELFVNFVYQPVREVDGTVGGIFVHGVDVTDQVGARHRVEQLEERLRLALEAADVGTYDWDTVSGALNWDRRARRIFGVPDEGDVSYETFLERLHPEDGEEANRVVQEALDPSGNGEFATEYRVMWPDHSLHWVRALGRVYFEGEGSERHAVRFLGTVQDITGQRQLQQQLEAEQARLREVFQQAPALIAVLRGPEHVYEIANQPYLGLVGRREIVGKPIREALPELEGQGYYEMMDGVYRSGEPVVGNEMHALLDRTGDGKLEEGYFNFVFHPLREADGSVGGILIHAVEVTDQVRARQQVENFAAERNAILGQIADGVIVTDAEGKITFVNEAAKSIHGVSRLDVTPEAYSETYHLFTLEGEPYAPEELPLARAVRNGETVTDALWMIRRPDGVEVIAQGSAAPVITENGRRLGAVLTLRDVTHQQQLQRLLERERARLQQVFVHAPAVIAMYSGPDHVVTMVNPVWEQVVEKKDVLGRTFREVFPELEESGLYELLDRVYETGEPYVGNETLVPLDRGEGVEETFWNFLWQPLAGTDGSVREVFVHAVEVTAQVRARQEVERNAEELTRIARALEATNRELDQFAYVASHDLKAPLRGIANLSQWIEEDIADALSDENRQQMDLLRGRVHRMEGLIDGILEYSRAGRMTGKPEQVDTAVLVREVAELLDPPDHFTIQIAEDMPMLETERLPLQQVFMNLIGNAIKYTDRPDARVEVTAHDAGGFVEFAVADNGPGIAPEYHDKIFAIFQRLEARDQVEGTGIGLSLVKKIVEGRRGRVWVESQEGHGTTFRFTWPKMPERGF